MTARIFSRPLFLFLKFNVTGIPAGKTVAAVRLKLWSQTVDQDVTVRAVADTNWTEGTVTWNNQPAMGASLKTLRVYPNSVAVFNLPGAVTGNGLVSFGVQGSADVLDQFNSKETGTESNRPQLELVLVDSPSPNLWPHFQSSAFSKPTAVVESPYIAHIGGSASDPDAGDSLTFDKILGPDWLTVSASGVLGGTPPAGSATPAIATIRVRDQAGAFDVAELTIPLDYAPTLAAISDEVVDFGTAAVVTLAVGDSDTALTALALSGSADNVTLIPPANFTFSGTGATRTATITPAPGESGSTTISITVGDGVALTTRTFVLTVLTPLETWRRQSFGIATDSGDAADFADIDRDGIVNLLEYALGGDPNIASATALPLAGSAGGKLAITFTRTIGRTDITMIVQAADTPAGPWTDLASSASGAAFAALVGGVIVSETGTGATASVEVSDLYSIPDAAHPRRFMRVRVTRP